MKRKDKDKDKNKINGNNTNNDRNKLDIKSNTKNQYTELTKIKRMETENKNRIDAKV